MRRLDPIAAFDRYAEVHTSRGKADPLQMYREQASNLMPAVDRVLGEWMK